MKKDKELTRERSIKPAVYDVCQDNDTITLRMEVPGAEKDSINIQVEDSELIIEAQRKDTLPEGTYLVKERRFADYKRVFTLDNTVDTDKIDAKLENGVLTLNLKIKEQAKPKKIEVKAG
ncbi:Hsp20/alpha crystallin family protein [Spirochaetia bacterium 38H-sp]|uniref:Hsp20/alpha crystallin family protein n=1 Tax=Rarispira pelagica TaxID=3141764 RepID=A0ABU9UCE8_9SPIR